MQPAVASQEVGGSDSVKCYKEFKEESLDFVLLDFTNSMENGRSLSKTMLNVKIRFNGIKRLSRS